jgi:hypothetical protein
MLTIRICIPFHDLRMTPPSFVPRNRLLDPDDRDYNDSTVSLLPRPRISLVPRRFGKPTASRSFNTQGGHDYTFWDDHEEGFLLVDMDDGAHLSPRPSSTPGALNSSDPTTGSEPGETVLCFCALFFRRIPPGFEPPCRPCYQTGKPCRR